MTKTSVVRGHIAGAADIDYDYLFGKLSEGLEWQELSLCSQIDPDLWYPEDGGQSPAKKMCLSCPVKQECLDYAMDNNELYGIWGGKTAGERELMRRKRNRERREADAKSAV